MTPRSPAARELALRLLTRASARREAPSDKVELASSVCTQLDRELSLWVGREGVFVLLRRALAVARNEHPALEHVAITREGASSLAGLEVALEHHDEDALFDGLLLLLITFIDLLGRFLGENLTTAMLEKNWPESNDSPSPRGDRSPDHGG